MEFAGGSIRKQCEQASAILSGVEGALTGLTRDGRVREFCPRGMGPWQELLATPVALRVRKGSFDFGVIRFANDNFAQDDKLRAKSWRAESRKP